MLRRTIKNNTRVEKLKKIILNCVKIYYIMPDKHFSCKY